ncbi:MAG: toll/interleukin-1 receptor domain-containing protein [Rhodobacteraceae bacterium]|nr:toll/interleukin-1 receptor domain-containing protein [Paracoccaceae bacterium]
MADPKQVDLLRQGVEVWNQYAQTVDKIDLSWANLEGLDLPRADLRRADLRWANLRRADLWGANLVGADLWGANLNQANLMLAFLDEADLRGAQLFGVDLSDAFLQGADCRTVVTFEGERRITILSRAIGLTQKQLDDMIGDRGVIIPAHLTYPEHWPEPPGEAAVPAYTEGPFVFISYARANKAEVVEIVRYLRAHNINIWWDDDIAPGDKWRDQITEKLAECQAVLTLWTEQSVKSGSVIEEAEGGKHGGKLLHARLDSAPLPYGFGEVQYADLTHWDRRSDTLESSRLLAALKQKLDPDDAKVKQQLIMASAVEFETRNGKLMLGDRPLNRPPPAHNPKDLEDLRAASIKLIGDIQEDFSTRTYNFDVGALSLRLSQYATVLSEKSDNWYKHENAVRRIKNMTGETGEEAWGDSLIDDVTILFEHHDKMRKYLQPEQPPAGTPGAIGPEPLASGTADAAAIEQQLQAAISDPKLGDIADPEVAEYFKDLDADLKDSLSQRHFDAAQDDRRHRRIMRGLVNLAKAAAGFTTAVAAGLTTAVIGDPTAAHHVLAQFNAILDKLLKIF